MRTIFRRRVFGAALAAIALVAAACGPGGDAQDGPTITVGSFAFTESEILAEIYAQALEAGGYPVETRLNVGSREIVKPALETGELDLVPEYIGTLLTFLGGEPSADTQATWAEARQRFEETGVTLLEPAPAQNKNGFVVTRQTAERLGLGTVSDLREHAGDLDLGAPPECPEREHCIPGLRSVYGIEFGDFRPLEIGSITVEALRQGEVDVGLLFTTDAFIVANDFVLLEDDQGLQPAENITPAVRQEIVDAYGDDLVSLVDSISRLLTTEELTALNARVQIDREDASQAARDWLAANGFLEG